MPREEKGGGKQLQTPFPLQVWGSHSFVTRRGRGRTGCLSALQSQKERWPHFGPRASKIATIIILSLLPLKWPLRLGFLHLSPWFLWQPSSWLPCAKLLIPQIQPPIFKFFCGNENLIVPLQEPSVVNVLPQLPMEHMITPKFLLYSCRILPLSHSPCSTHTWLLVDFWMAHHVMLCGFPYAVPSPWSPSLCFVALDNSILPSGFGWNVILSLWPMMAPLLAPNPDPGHPRTHWTHGY